MRIYAALLRGINVIDKKMIAMDDLRKIFERAGFEDVTTYIQSGNVIFRSSVADAARLERAIAEKVKRGLGMDVDVHVRTPRQLASIVRSNPFAKPKTDPASLHVTFLAGAPAAAVARELQAPPGSSEDRFAILGREVYLHLPNGYGMTKLNNAFFERRLATSATTRNWRTVKTLLDLTDL